MKYLLDWKRRIRPNWSENNWQTIFNLWISTVRFISSALIYAKGIYDVPFIDWVATVYMCDQYHAIHPGCYNGHIF